MSARQLAAALVAALVGFGGTIAVVLAAAQALGASPAETTSWMTAIALTTAIGSAGLSLWTRMPVVLAWSTPGAALLAATLGFTMAEAVAAFLLTGALVLATGLIPPLAALVARLPRAIAAAMLAGVLLPLVMKAPAAIPNAPLLVLPILVSFLLVRLKSPVFAVLVALLVGVVLACVLQGWPGMAGGTVLPQLVTIAPQFSTGAVVSLALPLFLVTMASQNLPGFAVMQGAGFAPPVGRALGVTGLLSLISAPFGAHTVNMAAITAAICLAPEVEPDRSKAWRVGLAYGLVWAALALVGPAFVAILSQMPAELMATIAGIALLAPLSGALSQAFAPEPSRFAAAVTLATGASGMVVFGIGAAFWALVAGLIVLSGEHLAARFRA